MVLLTKSRHSLNILLCLMATVAGLTSSMYQSWRWTATPNARLSGHVIETRFDTTVLSCITLCTRSPLCWTINHREKDGTCEMNDADDRWNDVSSAASDSEFSYYRKEIPRQPEDVDQALQTSECHPDHIQLDGSCLEIVNTASVVFTSAGTACDHKFGRLAVLDTPALETVLNQLLPYGPRRYWIDMGRDASRSMIWRATGALVNLDRPPWAPGQPDDDTGGSGPEDCGNIDYQLSNGDVVFVFMDVPCDLFRSYICQYDPWVYLAW